MGETMPAMTGGVILKRYVMGEKTETRKNYDTFE